MRLFKYLIISNELIDPHSIYLISPSEKQGKKDNPKTTILNINTIDDYINDKLIEIKHNKTYKYIEKQIVDFNTNASYEFKISNIDKIKSRYQEKVKALAERSCETIKANMFINRYLLPSTEAKYNAQSADDILLNKQIYLNFESYFSKYGFKVNDLNIGSSVLDQNSIVFCFDKDYRKISISTLNMFIDKNIETHSEGIKRKKSGKRENTHLQKIVEYKAELMSELPKEQVTRLTILNDADFVVELSYGLLKADNVKCYNISAYPREYQYSNKLMPVRLNDNKIKVYDFLSVFEKYSIKCISINDSYNEILDLYNKLVEQLRFKLTNSGDYKKIRRQKIQYLNKKIINKNYDSYFAYKQSLNKTRKILSRGENRYYLFKPYGDKPAIALMEIAYSNTCNKEFKQNNKAYLVIDNNSVSNLIKLSRGNSDDYTHSQTGKGYMIASDYTFCGRSTLCGENTCLNFAGEKFIGGAWSTIHSSKGTKQFDRSAEYDSTYLNILSKKKCHDYIHHMQNNGKVAGKGENVVAPNTDGLITTIAKFYKKSSKMTISLHQWLKCKSFGVKPSNNPDSILIHIGHTFDNRINYLKWLDKGYERKNNDDIKIKSIVEEFYENEKKKGIYRSEYVPVGIGYFSNTLKCNCTAQIGMECKYCEGVLYINTIEGLKDLYDQLTSDEYSKLE